MRIVKLSKKDPDFAKSGNLHHFFHRVIKNRKPQGKFRVPTKKIKQDGLLRGEPLLFIYKARVVFTARAASGLLLNDDESHPNYPNFFVIDMSTLEETDEDFYQVEKKLNEATGEARNLVRTQAWSPISDSLHTLKVWEQLRKN